MTPIHITIFWLLIVEIEVFRNWFFIVKLKEPIPHKKFAIERMIGSSIICAVFYPMIEFDNWIALPFMMAFTFWFLFDISLNLMRGKSILYFGEGSWLDRIQGRWPLPWVWLKFLLAASSITVFHKGISAVIG